MNDIISVSSTSNRRQILSILKVKPGRQKVAPASAIGSARTIARRTAATVRPTMPVSHAILAYPPLAVFSDTGLCSAEPPLTWKYVTLKVFLTVSSIVTMI